ncbi:hypothetical protein WR25_18338 [Diploscapter pachys]|uniref:Uncharacterized protein n=1 Tax=Diploscapter pachys TaxID=2018661 RepID=A0A2A2LXB4_9BILA|nr:hypothetical protein WR25_18338 [Diploscapter pachys]
MGVEQKLDAFRQKRKASGCLAIRIEWGRRNDRRDRRRQKTRVLLLLAVRRGSEEDEMLSMGEGIGGLDACCGQRQSISAQRQRNEERERGRSLLLSSTVSPFIPSLTLSTISPSFPSLSTVFTYSPFPPRIFQ